MAEPKERNVFILLMSVLLVLWICTLYKLFGIRSLWLDETITVWIVKDQFQDALSRALQFQGQSPFYYSLAWIFHKYIAEGELLLRIFSVFISLGTLVFFWLYAGNFLRGSAVIFAMLVMLSTDSFQVAMMSARPYALALFFSLASCWALLKWQRQANFFWLFTYVICAASTFYAHYLFGLIFVVHLLQVYFSSEPKQRLYYTGKISVALCMVAAICLPTLSHLRSLAVRADLIEFNSAPGLAGFLTQWLPADLLVYLLCAGICVALVLGSCIGKTSSKLPVSIITIGLFAPLILIPLLHFAFGVSLFHERYFLWYLPFMALAAGLLFSSIKDEKAKLIFATVFSVLVLARSFDKNWQVENWREASLALTQEHVTQDTLLLVNSGLVELRQISNYQRQDFEEYILAPFAVYPNQAKQLLIPFSFEDGEGRQYFDDKIKSQLVGREDFYLICLGQQKISFAGSAQKTITLKQYYQDKFDSLGYTFSEVGNYGQVSLLKFSRKK